jgi:hypothetical protein
MSTASRLVADDHCHRLEFLSRSWERHTLNPMAALYRSIEAGLESDSDDPGQVAGDTLMGLAVDRGLETPQSDLLGFAEHHAAIADFVVYLLREGPPWEHPEDKDRWVSGAYLNDSGSRLRRVVLVDRWSNEKAIAEEKSWRSMGECALYGVPMDLIVINLGQNREGRRHGPISKGVLHPQNHNLRFMRRDGDAFGPNWERVFRESSNIGREEWLESMTIDGVMEEVITFHEVSIPSNINAIHKIIDRKISNLAKVDVLPDPQFAQCFSPLGNCEFSQCCPYFQLPSAETGHIRKQPVPLLQIRS